MMIETSIIIPTFRRPDGLRRAVASCLAQQGIAEGYEIVVVDNNPDGSACPVVAALAAGSAAPVRYVAEPRPGISYARNAGVAAAAGRYIAFIDDDQAAEPAWLATLHDTLRRFEADAAIGPVRPIFPPGCPPGEPYPRNRFTRDLRLPTGSAMPRLTGIAGTLLRRGRCFDGPEPFDPRLALIGGEDTLFWRQQLLRGRKLVWCAEAVVHETVPQHRLEPRFLLRRAFTRGQVTSFVCAALSPPLRVLTLRMMLVGGAQAVLFGLPALALRAVNDPRWLPLMDRALLGLGKLLWHPRLQRALYR